MIFDRRNVAPRAWLGASAVLAAAALYYLAQAVGQVGTLPGDLTLLVAWQSNREYWLAVVMLAVSWLGFALPFLPLVLLVTVAIWLSGRRRQAGLLLSATTLAYAMSFVVKELVRRPRPSGPEVWVYGHLDPFGFPSQHVCSYTAFFGLLLYFAFAYWRGEPYRWPTLIASALLVLLIGSSRVYLGAHWPSDVLGGYLLGYVAWALAVVYDMGQSVVARPAAPQESQDR
ncbi:MAG: phosphatase PAP2 family protein [Chloroflexi bacterium]|nr:phosphatase PAP2 family protein [Chloroflexota bacterium]MCL5108197.1 phosphatase PAP2 family protein [Chloroflexota bacterium]